MEQLGIHPVPSSHCLPLKTHIAISKQCAKSRTGLHRDIRGSHALPNKWKLKQSISQPQTNIKTTVVSPFTNRQAWKLQEIYSFFFFGGFGWDSRFACAIKPWATFTCFLYDSTYLWASAQCVGSEWSMAHAFKKDICIGRKSKKSKLCRNLGTVCNTPSTDSAFALPPRAVKALRHWVMPSADSRIMPISWACDSRGSSSAVIRAQVPLASPAACIHAAKNLGMSVLSGTTVSNDDPLGSHKPIDGLPALKC